MFKDKTLLITGGTGSFGETIVKKFINTNIGEIRIFSRDEKKQEDMRILLNDDKIKFYIGDVRDYSSLSSALYGVDYVFRCRIKTSTFLRVLPYGGCQDKCYWYRQPIKAAIEMRVSNVVVLSTDKAVCTINAMGISKAMAEKVVTASSINDNTSTVFSCIDMAM